MRREKGQVLVLYGLFLTAILGMTSLAVDVGYLYVARSSLQSALDSAALAGATALPSTATAEARAVQFAQSNQVFQESVTLLSSNIQFGSYDSTTDTFTESTTGISAIRVTRQMTLSLFFGPILGVNTVDISAEAIGVSKVNVTCGSLSSGGGGGANNLVMGGNLITDSYNSNNGPYDPAAANSNGTICSNGNIAMNNTASVVNGSARPGPGKRLTKAGNATITGSTATAESSFVVLQINHPGCSHPSCFGVTAAQLLSADPANANASIGLTNQGNDPLDAGNNFSLGGTDSITINAGTYYFQNFDISGTAELEVNPGSGPVKIYVAGPFNLSGNGIATLSTVPSTLRIYITGSSASFGPSNDFLGVVIAPNAVLDISTSADIFGAVIGYAVTVSGSPKIHYDEAVALADFSPIIGASSSTLGR